MDVCVWTEKRHIGLITRPDLFVNVTWPFSSTDSISSTMLSPTVCFVSTTPPCSSVVSRFTETLVLSGVPLRHTCVFHLDDDDLISTYEPSD